MPKRSIDESNIDAATAVPDRVVQRKTERSHEENQERAYIAASRRADRSIEARVKSAQMASEIHKRRTGKGFKISEKIVRAEEMYEEEEDDMPRSYRMLAAHLQTNSPEMNYRVNAFLANRVAIASMVAGLRNEDWQQNPINKLFAEQFPNADKHAQAMSRNNSTYYGAVAGQAMSPTSSHREGSVSSAMSPAFGPINYQAQEYAPHSRSHSVEMSPANGHANEMTPTSVSPIQADQYPPPPQNASVFSPEPMVDPPLFPADAGGNPDNYFTAELPQEVKMMAGPGIDMNDPMASLFMGGDAVGPYYTDENAYPPLKTDPAVSMSLAQDDLYSGLHDPNVANLNAGVGDTTWDSCIDWDNNDITQSSQATAR